jgi:hypothetical protein
MGLSPFQIVYGMHLRGINESRNLGNKEVRGVDGEDFSINM